MKSIIISIYSFIKKVNTKNIGFLLEEEYSFLFEEDEDCPISDEECPISDEEWSILDEEWSILDEDCPISDDDCPISDEDIDEGTLQ